MRFALLSTVSLWTGGCDLFGPTTTDEFTLHTVNGKPLPAPILEFPLVGGGSFQSVVLMGKLQLFDDGTFKRLLMGHHLRDGVSDGKIQRSTRRGQYVLDGTTLTLQFTDAFGSHTVDYLIDANGTVLRGTEDYSASAIVSFEYRK